MKDETLEGIQWR